MYSVDYPHSKAISVKQVPSWDFETDVVVVGFGAAGACAAIEAADAGADVILYEVAGSSGGSAAASYGEFYLGGNGGTPIQRACGFEDSTENMHQFLLASQGSQANQTKLRLYAEGAYKHFQWLLDQGILFNKSFCNKRITIATTEDGLFYSGGEAAWPHNTLATPVPRGHHVIGARDAGAKFMTVLTDQVNRRSKITVRYDTRALCLIVDEQQRVLGLVVRVGIYQHFVRARKGVVLCAGGFTVNSDMVKQYAPQLLRATQPISHYSDVGSGIEMGLSVGAAVKNMQEASLSVPFYNPGSVTFGIFINAKGQRFINEDVHHCRMGPACLQQLDDKIFMIVSAEHNGEVNKRNNRFGANFLATADTAESLEKALGMPANTLAATLHFYNDHARNKQDPLFHKAAAWLQPLKAPLLAFDVTPGNGAIYGYFTLGGLDTLPTGEVLREDGSIIKGLYAAGRTTSGMLGRSDGYANGMSLGDATFFGRLVGQQVAKVIR